MTYTREDGVPVTGTRQRRDTSCPERSGAGLVLCCSLAACAPDAEAAYRTSATREMKHFMATEVDAWERASQELQTVLPVPQARGWDAVQDASALGESRQAWSRARTAYERMEGAIAQIFPESDVATDARYDDFLGALAPAGGDSDLFDAQGVRGMHAIERILWADQIPEEVVTFERGLPGYQPARFPATEAEARAVKEQLAAGVVKEIGRLREDFSTLDLDLAFAFRGLVGLAREQVEKVDRASTGQEESRYAQTTLEDLRSNQQGCRAGYEAFRPWVLAQSGGAEQDQRVRAALDRLQAAYAAVPGRALPRPPLDWSTVAPSREQLATPFGRLHAVVWHESDALAAGSLSFELNGVAQLLKLPTIVTR